MFTMNHLYILGNGFDLAHGLKTSYRDFVLWYLNTKLKYIVHDPSSPGINDGLMKIKKKQVTVLMLDPPVISDVKDFKPVVDKISNEHNLNLSISTSPLFTAILNQEGWADIEKLFFELLLDIHFQTNRFHNSTEDVFPHTIKGLNATLGALKMHLEIYLSEQILPNIPNVPLITALNHYFQYEKLVVGNTYDLIKDDKLFLNFNYTNTIGKYIINSYAKEELINIHGKIADDANPMIFGYGDEMHRDFKAIEDEDKNEYLENMKSFGYFKTNNYKRILNFIESEAYYVHVMGHSLGLSDRLLLNTLFEHENCKTIEIHYRRYDGVDNFTELTMNMSRHFKDKASMRKKVVDKNDSRAMN